MDSDHNEYEAVGRQETLMEAGDQDAKHMVWSSDEEEMEKGDDDEDEIKKVEENAEDE